MFDECARAECVCIFCCACSDTSQLFQIATVQSSMEGIFSECTWRHLDRARRRRIDDRKTLSSLMENSVRPSIDDLKKLSRRYGRDEEFKNCCLQACIGEQRAIKDIQTGVDDLLLQIFERLPPPARGFEDLFVGLEGMDVCMDIFEPNVYYAGSDSRGPLHLIVSRKQQLEMFCSSAPLIMDFLSTKFTLGLPDLSDTEGVLRSPKKLAYLVRRTEEENVHLVLGDGGKAVSNLSWFKPGRVPPDHPRPVSNLPWVKRGRVSSVHPRPVDRVRLDLIQGGYRNSWGFL